MAERFAGFAAPPPRGARGVHADALELVILGTLCTAYRDDAVTGALDAGRHLQPAIGDTDALVDRYDARLLLDNLRQFNEGEGDNNNGGNGEDGSGGDRGSDSDDGCDGGGGSDAQGYEVAVETATQRASC
ncbi:hypothetical protein FOA52_005859 [Chlamydomonas sp. UWO 241]|nr:hypothetical protein FOA52_005859 [Chlamydomonas sp. UWO 241]